MVGSGRRSGLHQTGDRPREADHLAGDGSGDHGLGLAAGGETAVSATQAQLRSAGDGAHALAITGFGSRAAFGDPCAPDNIAQLLDQPMHRFTFANVQGPERRRQIASHERGEGADQFEQIGWRPPRKQ